MVGIQKAYKCVGPDSFGMTEGGHVLKSLGNTAVESTQVSNHKTVSKSVNKTIIIHRVVNKSQYIPAQAWCECWPQGALKVSPRRCPLC